VSPDPLTHLYSRDTLCAQPSAIRDICALVARPDVRSLAGGWPDPEKFPLKAIRRIFDKLITKHGDRMLQYGSTEGLLELRQILADRMNTEGMVDVGPDNLMITHGSTQGMHLAAQVFVDREDVVFVGLPTYFGGPGAVRSRSGKVVGIPLDDQGMDVDRLRMEATGLPSALKNADSLCAWPKPMTWSSLKMTLTANCALKAIPCRRSNPWTAADG
jgi:DNA-binding transcriptional MocR family regulator